MGSRAEGVTENRHRWRETWNCNLPKKGGRRQCRKNEIVTGGEPERERHRKEM